MAFGQTASTFVGQNIGARNMKRAEEGTKATIRLSVIVTVTISAVVILFSGFFYGLFTKDPEVIRLGGQIARIKFPFYFLYVFLEVYASSVRGAGKTLPPMLITVVNMFGVRTLVLMLIMHVSPAPTHLAVVYPITWAVTAACHYLYYRKEYLHAGKMISDRIRGAL